LPFFLCRSDCVNRLTKIPAGQEADQLAIYMHYREVELGSTN